MKTHSHRQSSMSESGDRLVANVQPRPFSDSQFEQPDTQPYDLSQVDLFSHAPQRGPIQTKLTVGQPNDVYEQEADRVADQVISMPDAAAQQPVQREEMPEEELQMKPLAGLIQRESEAPEAEEEELQMKPLAGLIQRESEAPEAEEEELQMKPLAGLIQREGMPEDEELQAKTATTPHTTQPAASLESQLANSQGNGSPLPDDVRSFMEPRFGADFSQVRVHTGNESVQMNQDLRAQAFTHRQDIYFGAGKTPGNDALTAHELTHVIQQNGAIAKKDTDKQ